MSALFRSLFRLISLLFYAGNTLLLILIIISGGTNTNPINNFYWVQADTSGIPNAPSLTRWTFWGACSTQNGSTNCGDHLSPAYPISPVDNFGTKTNVPNKFITDRDAFYYLTRFSFCFFWIALAFIGVSFLLYVGTWCSYGFSKVVWILTSVGALFNVTAVVLQTAASVMARNAFSDADRAASLGSDLFGIAWASVVLSLLESAASFYEYFRRFKSNLIRTHQKEMEAAESHPLGTKSWFYSSKGDQPAEDPAVTIADPYAQSNANVTSAAAAGTVSQDNQHKGINFFTIRKTQKVTHDDDSV
ncbi:hypothetical protein HG536_0G04440 [Torulaspora globosa]|uniref:Uncharacterized protein n=1 Tax=Torulaspora globosa TaxID=48254 RepID=A0A7G3ZM46_9SACH|nr:uncharacterized protein HG536_0G04440 [Torulaspora globosa]QLL34582.1 hypothetical protein HG536_0G04440 [Torulaspora globosa]